MDSARLKYIEDEKKMQAMGHSKNVADEVERGARRRTEIETSRTALDKTINAGKRICCKCGKCSRKDRDTSKRHGSTKEYKTARGTGEVEDDEKFEPIGETSDFQYVPKSASTKEYRTARGIAEVEGEHSEFVTRRSRHQRTRHSVHTSEKFEPMSKTVEFLYVRKPASPKVNRTARGIAEEEEEHSEFEKRRNSQKRTSNSAHTSEIFEPIGETLDFQYVPKPASTKEYKTARAISEEEEEHSESQTKRNRHQRTRSSAHKSEKFEAIGETLDFQYVPKPASTKEYKTARAISEEEEEHSEFQTKRNRHQRTRSSAHNSEKFEAIGETLDFQYVPKPASTKEYKTARAISEEEEEHSECQTKRNRHQRTRSSAHKSEKFEHIGETSDFQYVPKPASTKEYKTARAISEEEEEHSESQTKRNRHQRTRSSAHKSEKFEPIGETLDFQYVPKPASTKEYKTARAISEEEEEHSESQTKRNRHQRTRSSAHNSEKFEAIGETSDFQHVAKTEKQRTSTTLNPVNIVYREEILGAEQQNISETDKNMSPVEENSQISNSERIGAEIQNNSFVDRDIKRCKKCIYRTLKQYCEDIENIQECGDNWLDGELVLLIDAIFIILVKSPFAKCNSACIKMSNKLLKIARDEYRSQVKRPNAKGPRADPALLLSAIDVIATWTDHTYELGNSMVKHSRLLKKKNRITGLRARSPLRSSSSSSCTDDTFTTSYRVPSVPSFTDLMRPGRVITPISQVRLPEELIETVIRVLREGHLHDLRRIIHRRILLTNTYLDLLNILDSMVDENLKLVEKLSLPDLIEKELQDTFLAWALKYRAGVVDFYERYAIQEIARFLPELFSAEKPEEDTVTDGEALVELFLYGDDNVGGEAAQCACACASASGSTSRRRSARQNGPEAEHVPQEEEEEEASVVKHNVCVTGSWAEKSPNQLSVRLKFHQSSKDKNGNKIHTTNDEAENFTDMRDLNEMKMAMDRIKNKNF